MDLKKRFYVFYNSRKTTLVVVALGGVCLTLLVFHAGVAVGERRAFNHFLGQGRAMPTPGFGFLPHGYMPEGHGAVGIITAVELPILSITTRSGGIEKIYIASSTVVQGPPNTQLGAASLLVGKNVVVIGEPNPKEPTQIDARLIHILPSPAPLQP